MVATTCSCSNLLQLREPLAVVATNCGHLPTAVVRCKRNCSCGQRLQWTKALAPGRGGETPKATKILLAAFFVGLHAFIDSILIPNGPSNFKFNVLCNLISRGPSQNAQAQGSSAGVRAPRTHEPSNINNGNHLFLPPHPHV